MTIRRPTDLLAHDDAGGDGDLVVLLPGAGDVRSEHRHLAWTLGDSGYRVVTADLPGHGDSPLAGSYGVAQTAEALLALIDHLEAGPAVVIGASFSPAAAIWAAALAPSAVAGVVAISPHMEAESSPAATLQRLAIQGLLRGPLAARLWTRLYRSWYPSVPSDLGDEIKAIRAMMRHPGRRRAVRETLVADRQGMGSRLDAYGGPSLVVVGSADGHFEDPTAMGDELARRLGGKLLVVEGAGHYPHVEQPECVGTAVRTFLEDLA